MMKWSAYFFSHVSEEFTITTVRPSSFARWRMNSFFFEPELTKRTVFPVKPFAFRSSFAGFSSFSSLCSLCSFGSRLSFSSLCSLCVFSSRTVPLSCVSCPIDDATGPAGEIHPISTVSAVPGNVAMSFYTYRHPAGQERGALAMDFRSTQFEFRRVRLDRTHGYWGFKDDWFVPYVWLEERDIPRLPLPFATFSLHYDSPVGRVSADPEMLTNIIPLPDAPGALALQSDLRKDLRRVTRLNSDLTFRENVPEDLEAACTWFAEQFHECKRDLGRRLSLYLAQARWRSEERR